MNVAGEMCPLAKAESMRREFEVLKTWRDMLWSEFLTLHAVDEENTRKRRYVPLYTRMIGDGTWTLWDVKDEVERVEYALGTLRNGICDLIRWHSLRIEPPRIGERYTKANPSFPKLTKRNWL